MTAHSRFATLFFERDEDVMIICKNDVAQHDVSPPCGPTHVSRDVCALQGFVPSAEELCREYSMVVQQPKQWAKRVSLHQAIWHMQFKFLA
jgi:hypothetical protein